MLTSWLWVDVTAQVGSTWADFFTELEMHHGLDINNVNHISLLHILFLQLLNSQLAFFAESWNAHSIQIRGGPNRSPLDMFGFDMLVHGVRGDRLPESELSEEELEVFGVDWEALQDDNVLAVQRQNNDPNEEATSWLRRPGPPNNLNEVAVDPPPGPFGAEELMHIQNQLQHLMNSAEPSDMADLWSRGLAISRLLYPDLF